MAYCTSVQVKQYLGIESASDDELLDVLIARAQTKIEKHTGRVFESTADTTRNFDAIEDTNGQYLWFDEDLVSITTVTNGDSSTITSTNYSTEPRNKTPYQGLKLHSGSGVIWTYSSTPEDAISITGKWAYSTSAPADITHAAIVLSAWYYRQRDTIGTTATQPFISPDGVTVLPSELPRDVLGILKPYRRLQWVR